MVSGWEVCYCLALSVSAQPQQLNIKPKPSLPFPWRKKSCAEPGENGLQFSLDGNSWMPQSEYEKEIPKIDWWTASEYEDWIATQKTELEALIGTGDGWYDGQGVFHEWTQDSVNAQIAEYEKILDEIKSGTLYSKDNDEGIGYAQIPPDGKDIVSVYGANFVRSDGVLSTLVILPLRRNWTMRLKRLYQMVR